MYANPYRIGRGHVQRGGVFENHLTIRSYLSGNCTNCQFSHSRNIIRLAVLFLAGFTRGFPAFGEDLGAHVAAEIGPLVPCSAKTAPTSRMMT